MRRLLVACLFVVACAASDPVPDAGEVADAGCVAGATQACTCDDGGSGTSTCANGVFGACVCEGPSCKGALESCGTGSGCCDGFTCEVEACRGTSGTTCTEHAGCIEGLLCVEGKCGACRDLAEPCTKNSECCGLYRCVESFCGD